MSLERLRRVGIRARLTFVFAVGMSVALGVGALALHSRFTAGLREAQEASLRSRAQSLLVALEGPGSTIEGGPSIGAPDEAFAQILGPDGSVQHTSDGISTSALLAGDEVAGVGDSLFIERAVLTEEEAEDSLLLAVPMGDGPVLVVGSSLGDSTEASDRLALLLAIGVPLAVALATLAAWWVAGGALRPIERLRTQADEMAVGGLHVRLSPGPAPDEVGRLGQTLNQMLDRLQEAVERERRFVDDASHELRTPLANLKAELDLALRGTRSPREMEAALLSAAEESERLSRLAEDLLVIARARRGELPIRPEPLDLSAAVGDAVRTFEARARDTGVRLEVTGQARATADPDRLRQMVGNLLDNAIRHSPHGGLVGVRISGRDGVATIAVEDEGEGFDPELNATAFEPFTTGTSAGGARAAVGPGPTLVTPPPAPHGGSFRGANRPAGGSRLEITLPV